MGSMPANPPDYPLTTHWYPAGGFTRSIPGHSCIFQHLTDDNTKQFLGKRGNKFIIFPARNFFPPSPNIVQDNTLVVY